MKKETIVDIVKKLKAWVNTESRKRAPAVPGEIMPPPGAVNPTHYRASELVYLKKGAEPSTDGLQSIIASSPAPIEGGNYCYSEVSIFYIADGTTKEAHLTIRTESLDKSEAWNFKGRGAPRRDLLFSRSGKVYPRDKKIALGDDVDAGFQNLVILTPEANLQEAALTAALHFHRDGLCSKGELAGLLSDVTDRLVYEEKINEEDKDEYVDPEYTLKQLIKRFRVPNKSISLRSYLARVIAKQMPKVKSAPSSSDETESIYGHAEQGTDTIFDVPINTLTTRISRGQLQVPKNAKGQYDWKKAKEAIEEYKAEADKREERKSLWNYLAYQLAEKKGSSLESARRTLRRWKAKGLTPETAAHKIKDMKV